MMRAKVGTITVALAFIFCGIALLLNQIGLWRWEYVGYIGPAVLVALGLEIIIMRLRHEGQPLRYSGLSFLVALLAIGVSLIQANEFGPWLAFVPLSPAHSLQIDGSLPVDSDVKRVEVDLPLGRVSVTGGDVQAVTYDGAVLVRGISREAAEAERSGYWTAERQGDALVLRLNRGAVMNWGWRSGLRRPPYLNVTVPPGIDVKVRTSNSRVNVERLTGVVDVRTSNSSVHISGVTGPVKAVTSNAAVNLRELNGPVEVTTSNGSITATSPITGDWTLSTSNGSIRLVVPQSTDATFQVATSNSRIGGTVDWQGGGHRGTSGHAVLGNGTHQVRLNTTNASIKVDQGY